MSLALSIKKQGFRIKKKEKLFKCMALIFEKQMNLLQIKKKNLPLNSYTKNFLLSSGIVILPYREDTEKVPIDV